MSNEEKISIRNSKIRDLVTNGVMFGVTLGMPLARWEAA